MHLSSTNYVRNGVTITFALSTAGEINITIPDIVDASTTPVAISLDELEINNGTETFGYLTLAGTTSNNETIDANLTFSVSPYQAQEGYFAAIYEQEGTNHVEGNLQRGDIIRLCMEAPGPEILEDEEVRLNFIPKIGTPTLTQFVTPDVISTERVYLYP